MAKQPPRPPKRPRPPEDDGEEYSGSLADLRRQASATPRNLSAMRARMIPLTQEDRQAAGGAQFTGGTDRAKRLGAALEALRQRFLELRVTYALTPAEQIEVLAALREPIAPANPARVVLPTKAPQLWANRDLNLRENAPQFIMRVYGPWLGKGLQRRELKRFDKELYKALSVWLSRHPDDPIVGQLPPQNEVMDDLIAELEALYPTEVLRKIGHAIDARARRK